MGVNPQTGEPVMIPGKNAVKFKPSKYLKTI
jgi:nucleoid DNA-binding protein